MSNANDLERLLLDLINDERGAVGLAPLRLITPLNAASEEHSQWMLETDTFSHTGEGGSSPHARMAEAGYPFLGATRATENIGWQSARGEEGYADDVADIHASLMQSPGHRANILDPNVEDIGLGVEIGTFSARSGDFEAVMVTQVFASTDADVSALIDPGTLDGDAPLPPDPMPEGPADDPALDSPDEEPEIVAENDPLPEEIPDEHDAPEEEQPDDMPDDDVPDDVPEEDSPEDVPAPEEPTGEQPEDERPGDEAPEEGAPDEDIPVEEQPDGDQPGDLPDEMPGIALPCGLENFAVDLRGAFEFRQDGDQLIWETSEDKLIAAFLAAFEDWTMQPPEDAPDMVEVFDDDDMLPEAEPDELCMAPEEEDEDEDMFEDMCL